MSRWVGRKARVISGQRGRAGSHPAERFVAVVTLAPIFPA